ncbi:MAG: hypothetical protein PHX18_05235 [Candidatus Gastranaerophilales bacterium]|nr:hypothetical protein [Candidatus Gastranaerophilales bacterium]
MKSKQKKVNTKNSFATSNNGYFKDKPVFSFKYYIKDNDYYTIEHSNQDKNCFYNFLFQSVDFCNKTWKEIFEQKRQFHFHDIEKEIDGLQSFPIEDVTFVQFTLPNFQEARFVGFFDDKNIFNIIIFDYKHCIYSRN